MSQFFSCGCISYLRFYSYFLFSATYNSTWIVYFSIAEYDSENGILHVDVPQHTKKIHLTLEAEKMINVEEQSKLRRCTNVTIKVLHKDDVQFTTHSQLQSESRNLNGQIRAYQQSLQTYVQQSAMQREQIEQQQEQLTKLQTDNEKLMKRVLQLNEQQKQTVAAGMAQIQVPPHPRNDVPASTPIVPVPNLNRGVQSTVNSQASPISVSQGVTPTSVTQYTVNDDDDDSQSSGRHGTAFIGKGRGRRLPTANPRSQSVMTGQPGSSSQEAPMVEPRPVSQADIQKMNRIPRRQDHPIVASEIAQVPVLGMVNDAQLYHSIQGTEIDFDRPRLIRVMAKEEKAAPRLTYDQKSQLCYFYDTDKLTHHWLVRDLIHDPKNQKLMAHVPFL